MIHSKRSILQIEMHSMPPIKAQLFIENIAKTSLSQTLRSTVNGIEGYWQGVQLGSEFKSVFRDDDSILLGYRAIPVAEYQGVPITESDLFSRASETEQVVELDRLFRVVHVLNFLHRYPSEVRLFLPVHEGLFSNIFSNYGSAFRKIVNSLGLLSTKIVLEIPPQLAYDRQRVSFVAQNYHLNGFEVCVQVDSLQALEQLSEVTLIDYVRLSDNKDKVVITSTARVGLG